MEIGKKIKEFRAKSGLSQAALGKRVGASKAAISKYENGASAPPYDVIIELARIFSVSTDFLLGADANEPSLLINAEGLTKKQIQILHESVSEYRRLNAYDKT